VAERPSASGRFRGSAGWRARPGLGPRFHDRSCCPGASAAFAAWATAGSGWLPAIGRLRELLAAGVTVEPVLEEDAELAGAEV
jgi:hypothetical protein